MTWQDFTSTGPLGTISSLLFYYSLEVHRWALFIYVVHELAVLMIDVWLEGRARAKHFIGRMDTV